MRTFSIGITVTGKITIPDAVLVKLREQASETPEEGGATHLNKLHKEFYEDDDKFLQAALKNALRSIMRAGLVSDIHSLGVGVGCRIAPATVDVSVPERVVTMVKSRQQIPAVGIAAVGEDGTIEIGVGTFEGSEPIA